MKPSALLATIISGIALPAAEAAAPVSELRHIEGSRPAGMSAAVVVDGQALAHTAQFVATGPKGEAPAGTAEAQAGRILDQIHEVLAAAGSGFDRMVRIHVNVASADVTSAVEEVLARRFGGPARPAVTFVEGKLALGALVAMDAIAAAPHSGSGVIRRVSRALPAAEGDTHVAILPAGPAVFISGYADPGDPEQGARATMEKLGAALALLGLKKSDVVQVKSFVATAADPEIIRRAVRAYFEDRNVPPQVLHEWRTTSRPVEIELVAAARNASGATGGAALEYLTPPGEKPNPMFTRIVRVNRGRLVYTSGLFGRTDGEAEPQIREIFSELKALLQDAGSDFEHMAKATYYVADAPASTLLNTIRGQLYNPSRPPAASKINVPGTGQPGKTITLDMIAVAPAP